MQTSDSSVVEPRVALLDGTHLLYDAALVTNPQILSFEPRELIERRALVGETGGRGRTYFIRIQDNDWVLRHYRRGGAIAPLLRDRYLWTGLERTRAWLEWRLLRELWQRRLPVPRPVAARVSRRALFYTADLITQRLVDTRSLADSLNENALAQDQWQTIGSCIRRFHEAGVDHGDLNAHNILLTPQHDVYLVDFDKSTVHGFTPTIAHRNLVRLRRSLNKLRSLSASFNFSDSAWQALCAGYGAGATVR
jgi:3-deoxy-D-manno-octulosonic acid kinase